LSATDGNKLIKRGSEPATLAEVLHHRAKTEGDRVAYTFLADGASDARSITWSQLDQRASALAALLRERGAAGQPVLLTLPSGLAFIESLFACWYAGAIAVPVSLPRHQRAQSRLHGIVADAGARFAIGTEDTRQRLDTGGVLAPNTTWIDSGIVDNSSAVGNRPISTADQRVALLQYTSGSTGTPRGVIVTHSNLMRNSALIAEACGHDSTHTIGGWLPLFHDMGLIGLVIQAAYSGARCVFMPPERFLMRPWQWLQMISDYGVCSSPAPNFAYDLCVDKISPEQKARMDLSKWRNALNGSEPVRAATLDRFANAFAPCGFRRDAFFPCYGLAEATLFVTGPGELRQSARRAADGTLLAEGDASGHVGCGQPFGDTQLAIVDPSTCQRTPPDSIGEIWVAGESCAEGYWNNRDATAATFNARLKPAASEKGDELAWLRTGDLGFVIGDELFITGRLRELIIIAGRNHFPVDLERTVESADPAIASSGAAAFSVEVSDAERLVIVAEVRREYGRPASSESSSAFNPDVVRNNLRAAVAADHEVTPYDVVLLRPGALPRTTSGKISRKATHDAYVNQKLERLETSSHAHTAV
jgi:acyl-CoA synthetase (AMP-forming)/AMP-acid ligase II